MRNRVVSFKVVDPADLVEHPDNWREHPNTQRAALREVLQRVGIADVILAYKSEASGKLTIVDGHLRRELLAGEAKVPVAILDLNDKEARAVVASHDPIGAMALRNEEMYEQLLAVVEGDDYSDIARMLDADGWLPPEQAEANAVFKPSVPADELQAVADHLLALELTGPEYPVREHARLAAQRIRELEAQLAPARAGSDQ